MKFLRFAFIIFGFTMLATSAHADLDYQCLNTCIADGKTSTACRVQCEYNKPEVKKPAANKHSHKVFEAPKPIDGIVLNNPHAKKAKPKADLDYACLNLCLKNGLQYQMCSEQCDKAKPNQHTK